MAAKLASGEWPVGKPIPSYRQLAAKYQVSVTTVRLSLQALARDGHLSIHARHKPIASLGKSLNEMMEGAIAVVLKDQLAHYLRGRDNICIWQGLTTGFLASNSPILVMQHWKLWRSAFPAGLHDLPLAGIVLLGPFRSEILRQYEAFKIPVVLVDQPGVQYKLHSVQVANYQAAYDATARMIEHGHTRIAFVRSVLASLRDIDPDARERQRGFLDACKERKLKASQYKVVSAILTSSSQSVLEAVQTAPRFTAILCANERHALQTANAAQAAGLNIPRELSIVTFHSKHSAERNWAGPRTDFEAIGHKAAHVIFQPPTEPTHALVPSIWNEGETLRALR